MKNKLRQYAFEKRKTFDNRVCSERILQNLFSLEEYKRSKNIICYYPLKYEVNVFQCLADSEKNWFLPKVDGENLLICPYNSEKISIGHYNISEPQTEKLKTLDFIDMIIIPCVAADKNGYRIGYGKGYYDRFLPFLPKTTIKVLPVYADLLFPSVYPESFDIKADIVVTEKAVLKI